MKHVIGKNVSISSTAHINISEHFEIGDRSVIRNNVLIEGRYIKIGREAWIDEHAHIGGGSCFDWQSKLTIGDFLHMGKYSHVNAAREVSIGDECGVGIGTKIFSHGAYLSAFNGFPVKFEGVVIGNRVWLPHAWVNPGVKIGDDVVVAAMSLVTRDLPSGCLAGGIPAKVLRENAYPKQLSEEEKTELVKQLSRDIRIALKFADGQIKLHETFFDLKNRVIEGPATRETEMLKNQLRRYGIRFKCFSENGRYRSW